MSSGFPSQPPSRGTSTGANQSDRPRPSSNKSAQRPPQQTKLVDTRCCSGDTNNTNHSYKENYTNQQQGQGMLFIVLYGNIDLPNCVCLSLFLILYIK